VTPRVLAPAELVQDPAALLPAGALFYFDCPSLRTFRGGWRGSLGGQLFADPRMAGVRRNNSFGFAELFSDLPDMFVSPERVMLASRASELAEMWLAADFASRWAVAGYANEREPGVLDVVFLVEVGADREPAERLATEWRDRMAADERGWFPDEGSHSDDFIDVWSAPEGRRAEAAYGLARNWAVVSTSGDLARDVRPGSANRIAGNGTFTALRRRTGSSQAAVKGFVRFRELAAAVAGLPGAGEMVGFLGEVFGLGRGAEDAAFYALSFDGPLAKEELWCSPEVEPGLDEAPGLAARLVEAAAGAEHWGILKALPFQPSPLYFAAMRFKKGELEKWLREGDQPFGRSPLARGFAPAPLARRVIAQAPFHNNSLEGEAAVCLLPMELDGDGDRSWLAAFELPEGGVTLSRTGMVHEVGDVQVFGEGADWRNQPAWTVLTRKAFKALPKDYLAMASTGTLLLEWTQQMTAESTLADNKDLMERVGTRGASAVWYVDVPGAVSRGYGDLSLIAKSFFPRSTGLNSRPPLSVLRSHAVGAGGGADVGADGWVRYTAEGPLPAFPVLGAWVVASGPGWIREGGRRAMSTSRENLSRLFQELQLYATQRGQFPASMEEFRDYLRRLGWTDAEVRSLLTSPAAVGLIGADAAATGSYRFVWGARPQDEPDLPLVYEAEAWHSEFREWFPVPGQPRREAGPYERWRLVLRLDGTILEYSERAFREQVAPRLAERE